MHRLRLPLVVAIFLSVASFTSGTEPTAKLARVLPKSPAESLAALVTRPGLRVELVAAEPAIRSPIAIDFDEDGRLYVVEYPEYNDHAATRPHGHGAIKLLEDADNDGRFERATTFAADVHFPSSVLCYDGGVFVAAAPDIWYMKDTTGDGVADVRERWYTGFDRDHAGEAMLNSLRWGLDNRVHLSTGSIGGHVRRVDRPDQKPISVRNMGMAFDPRTREWSLTGGGGQYGTTADDWGREFACSNSMPAWQVMYDSRYLARNPAVLAPAAAVAIAPEGKFTELHRISPVEGWRVAREAQRQKQTPGGSEQGRVSNIFTAASGLTIYRGDALGDDDRGDLFVGEVANNLVYRAKLRLKGLQFEATRAEPDVEFLASTDIWFRPAQCAGGPDGGLFVVDYYRELIEGADFLPADLLAQLDPSAGVDRGRIYRVVPDNFKRPKPPRLSQATTSQLVALLESRDGWHRSTASRLLAERRDPAGAEGLRRLVTSSTSPLARVHALYALATLGALRPADVLCGLRDPQPEVRQHTLVLAEGFASDASIVAQVATMIDDKAIGVRCQLAFSLGHFPGSAIVDVLARLAIGNDDKWIRLGVQCSSLGRAGSLAERLAKDEAFRHSPAGKALLTQLAQQIGAANDDAETRALWQVVESLPKSEDALGQSLVEQVLLARSTVAPKLELLAKPAQLWTTAVAAAQRTVVDAKQPDARRVRAVELLAVLPLAEVRAPFSRLLEPGVPEPVQSAMIRSLSRYRDAEVATILLAAWPTLGPQLRGSAIEVLLARPTWANALLDAIESEQVARAEIDPGRVQLLQSYPDTALRARAARIFATSLDRPRAEVFAKYRESLSLAGDAGRGRELFRKHCTACHRLEDTGKALGADLRAVGDRGAEAVLLNILDPNREVQPRFLVYVLATVDGEVITGLVSSETATSLTIDQHDGTRKTVRRAEIEALQSTGRSFMPDGIEKQIDVPAMADLLAYLLKRK